MALTCTSESIPVSGGRMLLGTWQGIFLFEHRRAPHTREIRPPLSPVPVPPMTPFAKSKFLSEKDAATEEAVSLYDTNVDKGFTVSEHLAFIQDLWANVGRKFQDITAYAGMYTRDLMDEASNPDRDPMSQEFAKREADRVGTLMAYEAATVGRQTKAFDIFDYISKNPTITVTRQDQLLPFDSKQGVKKEFDKAAKIAREEMEGLGNEAISTAPEDAITSKINQQTAAVVKGEASADVGEVVLDEVKPAETEEDLPEWFSKGQDALGPRVSAVIDEITTLIAFRAYLKRKEGGPTLVPRLHGTMSPSISEPHEFRRKSSPHRIRISRTPRSAERTFQENLAGNW